MTSYGGNVISASPLLRRSLDGGRRYLPAGRILPDDVWAARHGIVLKVLWLHVPAILAFSLLVGETLEHSVFEGAIVAATALVATQPRLGRSARSVAACIGLVTSSAILVHLSGGYIELHFHFFVMVALMAIYQEWTPFLVAIGYVVVHHAVVGWLAPESVFNHAAGRADPVFWAFVHGGFILALSAVCLVSWSYSYRAVIDALTGLANRSLLSQRLATILDDGSRPGSVAVLYIDLDEFKHVNDSIGHGGGDQLLTRVAARLVATAPKGATVARLGGDEFAIVLSDSNSREAAVLGRRIIDALDVPIKIGSSEIYQRASVGIALNGASARDTETLLRNADMAMYDAKAAGKARARFFRPELHIDHLRRLEFEGEIRRGLENDEFVLHYQPVIDLRTGTVAGFEALIRWNHPSRGTLLPEEFIPLAEDTGLIVEIGRWGVSRACHQLRRWQESDRWPADIGVAVNVSVRELKIPFFVRGVREAVAAAGIAAHQLTLEITETVLLSEPEVVAERLHALKEAGVRIAIDDFGSGYSSLCYLTRLPVDVLKIDRSLTASVGDGAAGSAVMQAALALGRTLGFQTVAEGVEEDAQLQRLRLMGCRFVQGFLLARALEPGAARQFGLACRAPAESARRRAPRAPRTARAAPRAS